MTLINMLHWCYMTFLYKRNKRIFFNPTIYFCENAFWQRHCSISRWRILKLFDPPSLPQSSTKTWIWTHNSENLSILRKCKYPSMYPSSTIYSSIHLIIHPFIIPHPSTNQPTNQSINYTGLAKKEIHPSIQQSINPSIRYPPIHPSIHPSFLLSIQ